jgi:hypothetical protein
LIRVTTVAEARTEHERVDSARRPWRTTAGAVALLVVLYALVIALGDARAFSGSDAGGKLATVVAMADHDTLTPDLGYWAEDADPDGDHHPLWHTSAVGDRWVQATSLPFVVAALPLYEAFGPAGALLLPMAGGVLAALAARRLSRTLYRGAGWAAFWLVGAAGPVLFYAADFWEHAVAVGLALMAMALALDDAATERPRGGRVLLAGVLAGLAVVVRAEMLLYGLAFAGSILVVASERRRWFAAPRRILLVGFGAAVPVVINGVVERVLLADGVRDGRAADSLSSAGANASSRVTDALVTSVGLFPDDRALALALGSMLVICLLIVGAHLARPQLVTERAAVLAGVFAALLYLFRFASGPGFAPGCLIVAPLAAVGVFAARTPKARVLLGTALATLPLVWLTAWQGNHLAQWGGRYVLLSGALLTILAVGPLQAAGWRRAPVAILVGLTLAVSAIGATWHIERTRVVADAVSEIEALPPDDVIVSDFAHLGREAGAWYGDHRWLRTARPGGIAATVAVAREAGAEALAVVVLVEPDEAEPEAPALAGFRRDGPATQVSFLVDQHLTIWHYERR